MKRALAACLALCGCAHYAVIGDARTLAPGKLQLALMPGIVSEEQLFAPYTGPTVAVSGRLGLAERLELGARLTGGVYFETRIQLIRGEAPGDVDVLVGPLAGVRVINQCGGDVCGAGIAPVVELPFVVGFQLTERVSLVVAQRTVGELAGPGAATWFLGGNVGVAIRISELFSVAPELGALFPVPPGGPTVSDRQIKTQGGVAIILTP